MTPVVSCAFCGRDNDPNSRYCIDCGKPMSGSGARPVPGFLSGTSGSMPRRSPPGGSTGSAAELGVEMITCPHCQKSIDAALPFCGHCGTRVGQRVSVEVNDTVHTPFRGMKSVDAGTRLALLDEGGNVTRVYTLDAGEAVLGRGDADIQFEDVYLSPLHTRLEMRDGELWLRDLGSRNGTWMFIDGAATLIDNDLMMIGSQLIRFRRLGYPGPRPPEADSTRRMGSLIPSADVAVLEQLRADGSVRDTFHLSPARTVLLGRESGDWVFPYDQTMSGKHCEVRSQDAEFFVHDAGSRNGVALAVRGDRRVRAGQRILVGDQVLRVESLGQ